MDGKGKGVASVVSLWGVAPQTAQTSGGISACSKWIYLPWLWGVRASEQTGFVGRVGCGSENRQQELPGEKGGGCCSIGGNGSSGRGPEVELPSGCMTFHTDITCTLRYLSYWAADTMRQRDWAELNDALWHMNSFTSFALPATPETMPSLDLGKGQE